ncbi:MAG: hypothetical protein QG632_619 [Candidatus Dependentiae bacterium]|nr:hypothetical protein [Candidatus Dependentiae bacterium]
MASDLPSPYAITGLGASVLAFATPRIIFLLAMKKPVRFYCELLNALAYGSHDELRIVEFHPTVLLGFFYVKKIDAERFPCETAT